MADRYKVVTIGTDGLRDYVELPDGLRLLLGPVSMASLVGTCGPTASAARKALDKFLEVGTAVVALDFDKLEALLAPRRLRASTDSLIPQEERGTLAERASSSRTEGMAMSQDQVLNHRISLVEQQVSQIAKLASARMPTEKAVEGLRELAAGLHFYDPGDQAKNDAWYTPGGKVDTVEDGKVNIPAEVMNPKMASEPSAEALSANANLAEDILNKLASTHEKVEALAAAGRKFNANAAKADLHKIASDVQTILTDMDLAVPYVKTDLDKLAKQANHIHHLFAQAKV